MAELTISWAGDSEPLQLGADDCYHWFALGTSVAPFGDAATIDTPILGAYGTVDVLGDWAIPYFFDMNNDAGAYSPGDDAGLYTSVNIPAQQVWAWTVVTPAYSQPIQPTKTTTYFWG